MVQLPNCPEWAEDVVKSKAEASINRQSLEFPFGGELSGRNGKEDVSPK